MASEVKIGELIVMTNSVLGLSILTMPFCFQQCGLILGTLSLLTSALMTSYSCKLLVSLINTKKTKTFEFLALRIFGHKAKLLLEISIILLLFGSLVTYHQTASDSGPNFLAKLFNLKISTIPRTWFMIVFTLTITLPLSLLKKLDNINKLSLLAIFFYFTLGFYLFWEALNKILEEDDHSHIHRKINLWKFDGLLKCFPIFSISFSCQTVLFVVYNELSENSKSNMTKLSDKAIFVSFVAYFLSGFFGYLAFYDVEIPGNVITIIPESFMSQTIIFGFIVCVVAGFPFMIFPCRTSLNTLLFSTDADEVIEAELFIPEHRYKYLTYSVVFSTAFVAVAIPNMEFVLSITGATAGSLICYVWPSMLYIYARNKSKDWKDLLSKIFLTMGIVIFFLCTAAALVEYQPTKPEIPAEVLLDSKEVSPQQQQQQVMEPRLDESSGDKDQGNLKRNVRSLSMNASATNNTTNKISTNSSSSKSVASTNSSWSSSIAQIKTQLKKYT